MTTTEEVTTVGTRFALQRAIRAIRRNGVIARTNVYGCCRSCLASEHPDDIQTIWHYGSQGSRLMWDDNGSPVDTKGAPYGVIYFNHTLSDANKDVVLAEFGAQGLVVDWDGSDARCVGIVGVREGGAL